LWKFNAINFTVFDIPGYIFFAGVGVVAAVSTFIILLAHKKYPLQINMRILMVSILALSVSTWIFGKLSGIYREIGVGEKISWAGIKNTGIVYYGGLFGLLIAYKVCSKYFNQNVYVMDILAVIIPLFHAFARIGCFVGGCCFGIESDWHMISIYYTTTIEGEINTSQRIPIQLIESMFNACLFIYLLRLYRMTRWKETNILRKYLFLYSVGRFVIEFFRGDAVRGVIYGVSFSQMISIFIWIYLLVTRKACNKNKIWRNM